MGRRISPVGARTGVRRSGSAFLQTNRSSEGCQGEFTTSPFAEIEPEETHLETSDVAVPLLRHQRRSRFD